MENKEPYLWFDTDQESWSYDKPLRPTYIPLFQHAEAEEAETLRPLVLKFAGAVNLDKDWCKDNEPTINILRACLHKYMDAMALIRQGVRAVEK